MKKTKSTLGIKLKILTGFLLLLSFAIVAVLSIIKLATQLTPPDPGVSSSVSKLTITSNLLSNIIEADGQARAYISTGKVKYLNQYQQHEALTHKLVDTLTSSSLVNTNQYLRMLAVDSLLDLKREFYTKFFDLKRQNIDKNTFDFEKFTESYNDSISSLDRTISKTIIKELPAPVAPKPGLIKKLWDNLKGKKKADTLVNTPVTTVNYDTLLTYKTVRDTTLNLVRLQLEKMEEQERVNRQIAVEREMLLVQSDQDIMNEIRAVLLLFEKEEISRVINGTETSHNVLTKLWNTALALAAIGLFTSLVFIIMIWKDLAKSTFYRKQLEKARSLAEALLKVKEQFLANMSHEIRTPLTSIIGFTEMLSSSQVTSEQARYIKYINSSSEHLLELINDLLDFSRIDSGKLTFDSRPFIPSELFEQAFETLKPRAQDKGLEVILKQNIPHVVLVGDPLRLRQIIYNLLSNSIKFTDKGKIMLQVKATLTRDNIANLTIRVADTGIGIPKEKLEVIFDEFTQVDHSITRKYGGSGLGLAISKKLVEMMNGTMTVHSKLDHGTIFTIKLSLPIHVGELIEIDDKLIISELADLSKYKILLAEDDVVTRMLLVEYLENRKATVHQAADGVKAFELFTRDPERFNLLMTDIQMPGMSGLELVEQIIKKCTDENIELPLIIGLTAHASTEEIAKYKAKGMNHFLTKPFKNADLQKVLNINFKESPETSNVNINEIDLSSFRKFAGNDEDSLQRILISLSATINDTARQMQEAFDDKRFKDLSLLAHRMMPNTRLLGDSLTAMHLLQIEQMCKQEVVTEDHLSDILTATLIGLYNLKEKLKVVVSE